jgi:hypothetical protein
MLGPLVAEAEVDNREYEDIGLVKGRARAE